MSAPTVQGPTAAPPALSGRQATSHLWVALDLLCLAAFSIGGLSAHGGRGLWHLLVAVIVPYTAGWFAAAWAVGLTKEPYSVGRALLAWPFAISVGLTLRVLFVVGAFPTRVFVLVSAGFLGATLVGWRAIAAAVRAVRSRG